MARVWRDTLGLQLTCPENDFFDLGGDSLRAITMTFELEKALRRDLPTNLISQAPTFAAFCARLRENAPVAYCPLVTLKPGQSGSLPPRTVHDDKNASQSAPLKFLVFHVAKKGDPLAVPVQ